MSTKQLRDDLLDILANDLAVDTSDLTLDSRLVEDLGLDSVAFAIALVAIEDRTGVRLSEASVRDCQTVGDLTELLPETAGS